MTRLTGAEALLLWPRLTRLPKRLKKLERTHLSSPKERVRDTPWPSPNATTAIVNHPPRDTFSPPPPFRAVAIARIVLLVPPRL